MQQFPNPLAAIANTARTFNEQANTTVKALSDTITQASNTFLGGLAQGIPGLPIPGAPASHTPGHVQGMPNIQTFLAPFTQLADVLLPPGLPRPSQVLLGTAPRPRTQPAAAPAANERVETPAAPPARTRVTERRGV